jgi:hypothetical protein
MSDDTKVETPVEKPVVPAADAKADAVDVTKLSTKDVKWHARYKEEQSKLESEKAANATEKKLLADKIAATKKEKSVLSTKLIDAELKAHAVAAGLTDMDFIQLVDKTGVKLNEETGAVEGVDAAIEAFKTKKPGLFAQPKNNSSSKNASFGGGNPGDTDIPSKSAHDMTKDEWSETKRQYGLN